MTAQEAIAIAKKYAGAIFASEGALNLGLEELRFDDVHRVWNVTLGFTRGWEGPQGVSRWNPDHPLPRTFKTVEVRDSDGEVKGIKHWPVAA